MENMTRKKMLENTSCVGSFFARKVLKHRLILKESMPFVTESFRDEDSLGAWQFM